MKLVTGARGMLGREVVRVSQARGVDIEDGDLAEPGVAERLIENATGVIHCAGYTDVDGAESDEERAHRDNVVATTGLAKACEAAAVRLLVVSTDFVFDGRGKTPYHEDDATHPLGAYGRTKLAAERAALETDLQVVQGRSRDPDGGVPHGATLRRFAEAVVTGNGDLAAKRAAVVEAVGAGPAAHAAGVIASFDAINRVADATGIGVDAEIYAGGGSSIVEELGLESIRGDRA